VHTTGHIDLGLIEEPSAEKILMGMAALLEFMMEVSGLDSHTRARTHTTHRHTCMHRFLDRYTHT
jgi:hypothetical protein